MRPQLKYRFTVRVREACVHADGTARAQLFLIRALQGYQLPSKGQRVHNEASRRAIIQRFNIIQCNLFLETILFIAVQTSIIHTRCSIQPIKQVTSMLVPRRSSVSFNNFWDNFLYMSDIFLTN